MEQVNQPDGQTKSQHENTTGGNMTSTMRKIFPLEEKSDAYAGEHKDIEASRKLKKIAISEEANDHLQKVVRDCNEGYHFGRIDKQTIASHAILNLSDADVNSLRRRHKDFKSFLTQYLRENKSVISPSDFTKLIHSEFGIQSTSAESTPSRNVPENVR